MFLFFKANFPQSFGNGLWVEVIVQLNKLDLFRSKWIPALTAQDPAQDRLEIAFVGKFEQKTSVFRQHTPTSRKVRGASAMWWRVWIMVAPSKAH